MVRARSEKTIVVPATARSAATRIAGIAPAPLSACSPRLAILPEFMAVGKIAERAATLRPPHCQPGGGSKRREGARTPDDFGADRSRAARARDGGMSADP